MHNYYYYYMITSCKFVPHIYLFLSQTRVEQYITIYSSMHENAPLGTNSTLMRHLAAVVSTIQLYEYFITGWSLQMTYKKYTLKNPILFYKIFKASNYLQVAQHFSLKNKTIWPYHTGYRVFSVSHFTVLCAVWGFLQLKSELIRKPET